MNHYTYTSWRNIVKPVKDMNEKRRRKINKMNVCIYQQRETESKEFEEYTYLYYCGWCGKAP